jgi:hypothetical protein
MDELIRQIRAASAVGLHYLALFGALSLPDICGSLASERGSATPTTYKEWLKANVPEHAQQADLIYALRSSLLHQGRAKPHGSLLPVAFTFPSPNAGQLHNLSVVSPSGEGTGFMSIPMLVQEITTGAERWLTQYGDTNRVKKNMEKFARYRPEGLPGIIAGAPVIA